MKKLKKGTDNMECWSGFSGILGVAFIVIATILTLITMNGLGILGMFIVGIMLCRKGMVMCPCHEFHKKWSGCCDSETASVVAKPKKTAAKKTTTKK